jgi:hypothetical protein
MVETRDSDASPWEFYCGFNSFSDDYAHTNAREAAGRAIKGIAARKAAVWQKTHSWQPSPFLLYCRYSKQKDHKMTVSQLIELLKQFPADLPVQVGTFDPGQHELTVVSVEKTKDQDYVFLGDY